MPKPNYQRDKRQRDLARQRKQEEKRQKKALRGQGDPAAELTGEAPELGVPEGPAATAGAVHEAPGTEG